MTKHVLDAQSIQDIMLGATLYGSGGGGPVWMGQQIAKQIGDVTITLVSADSVPDNDHMAICSFFGNPDLFKNSGINYSSIATQSFQNLEDATGQPLTYVLPLETGGGNSLIPIAVAAQKNIAVVDVDGAHRAMPVPFGFTWMALPIGIMSVSAEHEQVHLSGDNNITTLGAFSSMIFANQALIKGSGVSLWSMTGVQMKSVAIKGSLSDSLSLGRAIRQAKDPVATAIKHLNGELLGIGKIKSVNVPAVGTGSAVFSVGGDLLTVISSSENVLAWHNKSNQPLALAPDLISYMTTDGHPLAALDLVDVSTDTEIAIIRSLAVTELYQAPIIQTFNQVLASLNYYGQRATGTL